MIPDLDKYRAVAREADPAQILGDAELHALWDVVGILADTVLAQTYPQDETALAPAADSADARNAVESNKNTDRKETP